MRLSIQSQIREYVVVIRCQGRITSGEEVDALQVEVDNAVHAKKRIVLQLAEVTFIDSAGLGFLVRLFSRLRVAGGGLKLCQLSPVVQKALQVTNLHVILPTFDTEHDAVLSFGMAEHAGKSKESPIATVVCIDDSGNVLAYLNGLLTAAGYEVFPTRHLNDAKTLVSAIRPRVVIFGPGAQTNGPMIDRIRHTIPDSHMILLPADFSTEEASQAGEQLVTRVRSALGDHASAAGAH